ncbi:peptidase M24- structural domain-containing protein [Apiospora hydei]|uniref:Xaa-Pro aminopeptidase n=1 Tax=Apiospora hydei TaxID=1337664 RepID=A0ABR1V562_9PEZI
MEAAVEYDVVSIAEFDALHPTRSDLLLAKEHANKVTKQLGVQNGLVYLPGKGVSQWEDSDMGPPFRQRRFFYYMSGANFPGCAVTYDIGADNLILWIPYTPPSLILWFGTTPSPDECLAKSDVDNVKYISDLPKYLNSTLGDVGSLYVLRAEQIPKSLGLGLLKPTIKIDTSSLLPAMAEARVVKTDYEVAMIRRANDISSAAHRAVCAGFRRYANECEVEAAFLEACSYPVIAGAGPNAATLHYDANDQPLAGRQHLVLDAGAEWECYASDVTRTLPVGGQFTTEGKAIYDVVARMQEECIDMIAPGTGFRDMHLHAHRVATQELLKLGILRRGGDSDSDSDSNEKGAVATAEEVETILESGVSSAFFPHGLGHHVGLEVHDVAGKQRLMSTVAPWIVGSRKNKRDFVLREDLVYMIKSSASASSSVPGANVLGRALEPGMVVTVEPGIYFCREYIEVYYLSKPELARYIDVRVLDRYWDVGGVRIEDCILVTEDGYENLTTAPKGEEMLKVINGK